MATQTDERVLLRPWVPDALPIRDDRRHRLVSRLLGLPTDEELAREMEQERVVEDVPPERVPPDDPDRLAWEAELRALGITPAKLWNFPVRKPLRRPDWRDWLRERLGG